MSQSSQAQCPLREHGGGTEGKPFYLLALLLCTLCILIVAGPAANFPINDDGIYANCTKNIVEHGVFSIEVSNAFDFVPILVGAAVCKIVGWSYDALRWTNMAFHLFGVAGIYLAAREVKVRELDAALISSVYAFNPYLINLSLTFMSDVPATALLNWSLYALTAAVRRKKLALFLLAIIWLTLAAATRQTFLIYLPVIICCAIYTLKNSADRILIGVSASIPLLACVCLHYFMVGEAQRSISSYSGYSKLMLDHFATFTSPQKCLEIVAKGSCYLGLLLMPAAVPLFCMALRHWSRATGIALLAAFLLVACPLAYVQAHGAFMPYSLNLFMPPILGTYCVIGGTPAWSYEHLRQFTYFADFTAFVLVFCLSLALFSPRNPAGQDEKPEQVLIVSTLVCCTAGLILQMSTCNFDRYYMLVLSPLLLCLTILWRRVQPGRMRLSCLFLSLVMGTYALLAVSDNMNFLRAQWQTLQKLKQAGVPPERIDGGALHSLHVVDHPIFSSTYDQTTGWPARVRGAKERSDLRWWPVLGEDYIVATDNLKGYHVVGEVKYWATLAFKHRKVLVLKSDKVKDSYIIW